MILFLQYLLEKMKSMLNIPISPLHLGLRPCNRSTLEDENGSYSLDGIPPETTIVSPVIYEASSDAKKAAAAPMSSVVPSLPSNVFASSSSLYSSIT
jgi:hypothetical protein